MKTALWATIFTVLMGVGMGSARLRAAEEDGVALALIYDTSGSMKETVPDRSGQSASKYFIANRALQAVARQIQSFATNTATGTPRKIYTGLFTFQGAQVREPIKFGPFDAAVLTDWAERFSNPNGSTPLGNALATASQAVLKSPLSRKHVLIITDGINTVGPDPAKVLPRLKERATQSGAALGVHFVAFDVDAKVFEPVKKLGATVVAAADETQLNAQLQYILQQKILLEEEEPTKTK